MTPIHRLSGRRRRAGRWLLLGTLLLTGMVSTAQAQLFGLTHDQLNNRSELASIDPVSGAVTPLAGNLPSIELTQSAVANNPFTQQIFTLGPDPVAADGSLQLVRFDLATGNGAVIGNTGSFERVISLNFERSTQRLIAALVPADSNALRLVSVDPNTAALTQIHSGLTDCCIITANVSALSGGSLYFTGRLATDAATTQRLFGFSTAGDNIVTSPTLAANLGALVEDPASGTLYGLQQTTTAPPISASLQLVDVATNGVITPLGAATTECCAVAIDVAAIQNGVLQAIARSTGATQATVLSANLASGVISFSSGGIAPERTINALFDELKGLTPTTTTITSLTPNPVTVGNSYSIAATVTATTGTPTGTVTVSDGLGNNCSFAAPSGNCNLTATAVGMVTITASFTSSGNFSGSSDNAMLDVQAAASTTTITAITPSPSMVGGAYTVNVSVSGFMPSGMITVDDGAGAMCAITLPATSCMLTATTAGPRTITASYAGDANNLPSNDSAAHQVDRAASITQIDMIAPSPSIVGQAYTASASVTGFGVLSGAITIDDGSGANCVITLPATSCLLTSTSAGAKTINASYGGDTNNLPSGATAPHQVDQAASTTTITNVTPSPSQIGQSYTVTVAVSGFGSPVGVINVDDGAGALCAITLPATSCALTSTTLGAKTLTAAYGGDANNLPSSDTAAHDVQQAATTTQIVAVTPAPSTVTQPYNVQVQVSGFDPVTGTVDVDDGNGNMCQIVLPADNCDLTTNTVGAVTLTAAYSGDVNNLASSDTQAHQVVRAVTTTAIDSIVPSPSRVGDSYTVSASVSSPITVSGDIVVDDGAGANCTITLPATSCALTSTVVGPKTITAAYAGDVNNDPSNATQPHDVERALSTTQIISLTPSPAVVNQPYTVDVQVTGFAPLSGTVDVDDGDGNSCQITLPATSCQLTSLNAGARTITAAYSGDVNNEPSSDTATQTIDRAASTTTIDAVTPSPSRVGEAYTVSASASGFGTLTGSIQINDGAGAQCTITLPGVSCALTSTVVGAKTLTAAYSGDSNNLPSNATQAHDVQQAISTTQIIALTPSPGVVNNPYSVQVQVSGFAPVTGNVTVDDGNGASCTITLPADNCALTSTVTGNLTITAAYGGDINNLASSATATQTVMLAQTILTLDAMPNPVLFGQPVDLIATISNGVLPLGGAVAFRVEGELIAGCEALPVTVDQAICTTTFNIAAPLSVSAEYSGDGNNIGSSDVLGVVVQPLVIPTLSRTAMLLLMVMLMVIAGYRLTRQYRPEN
ncbi:MAG: hypothetical protein Tsb002_35960 [Wenzhouxiangellaceae bacterium]